MNTETPEQARRRRAIATGCLMNMLVVELVADMAVAYQATIMTDIATSLLEQGALNEAGEMMVKAHFVLVNQLRAAGVTLRDLTALFERADVQRDFVFALKLCGIEVTHTGPELVRHLMSFYEPYMQHDAAHYTTKEVGQA